MAHLEAEVASRAGWEKIRPPQEALEEEMRLMAVQEMVSLPQGVLQAEVGSSAHLQKVPSHWVALKVDLHPPPG